MVLELGRLIELTHDALAYPQAVALAYTPLTHCAHLYRMPLPRVAKTSLFSRTLLGRFVHCRSLAYARRGATLRAPRASFCALARAAALRLRAPLSTL